MCVLFLTVMMHSGKLKEKQLGAAV